MPIEAWYLEKSLHCARLADEATDPRERYALAEEAVRWREIAADIARQERSAWPP